MHFLTRLLFSHADEELNDDVKLVAMRRRKASLHQHIPRFVQRQLKSDGKSNRCGLARLVELVTADIREEFPVNICLLVALCVRHAAFVNLPQQDVYKRQDETSSFSSVFSGFRMYAIALFKVPRIALILVDVYKRQK